MLFVKNIIIKAHQERLSRYAFEFNYTLSSTKTHLMAQCAVCAHAIQEATLRSPYIEHLTGRPS